MKSGETLIFVYDRVNKTITCTQLGETQAAVPFIRFFNEHLSASFLHLPESEYSPLLLENFFLRGNKGQSYVFTSGEDGFAYTFFIESENQNQAQIELREEKQKGFGLQSLDFLTKVYSRRALYTIIHGRLKEAATKQRYLILLDLDNFKTINDSFGHVVGDLCLKEIAKKLNEIFSNQVFGRFGGDEFLAYVEVNGIDELISLTQACLDIQYDYGKFKYGQGTVTCSIGITKIQGNAEHISPLIEEADEALYKTKKYGKNIAITSDGLLIRGNKKEGKEKKKTISSLKKSKTSILFKEEVKGKRKKLIAQIISICVGFTALVALIDVSYTYGANKQASFIAKKEMGDNSASISSKVNENNKDILLLLHKSASLLDTLSESGSKPMEETMLEALTNNTLIENPALLFENGDIYYADGNVYSISTSDFAISLIGGGNSEAIGSISNLSGLSDRILFGVSYSRSVSGGKIAAILSLYTPESYSASLFKGVDSYVYASILDSSGKKVCQNSVEGREAIEKVKSIPNYFSSIGNDDLAQEYKTYLSNGITNLTNAKLSGESCFIYCAPISETSWSIFLLAPYKAIFATFSSVVVMIVSISNIVSVILLGGIVVATIYAFKIKLRNFYATSLDPITLSINESRFMQDAEKLREEAPNESYLAYLNLRGFKLVNSQIGNNEADKLLARLSKLIEKELGEKELLSREYGDRFLLLLRGVGEGDIKSRLFSLLPPIIESAKSVEGVDISFDCGVFPFKEDVRAPIWLAVSRARNASKREERDGSSFEVSFFDKNMLEKEELALYIEQSQEAALANNRFMVYYQGKYSISKKRFVGCEALVRWKDEEKGFINTQTFIDVFERNGFVAKLDLYVFEQVLKQIKERLDSGKEVIPVSINLSRKHFNVDDSFAPYEALIKQYGIEGKYLEFEITESIILNSENNLTKTIDRIHALGARVSIDDFGSGFSNFSMINHVDYDALKIDRKLLFGRNGFDAYSRNVLYSVVSLNSSMGKTTICEGVEHQEESDYLYSIGCDIIQGYFYCKPMDKDSFEELVEKTNK